MSKANNGASVGKFSIDGKFSIKQTIATLYPIAAIILAPVFLLLVSILLTLAVFFEPSWTQAETASVVVRNFGLVLAGIFGFGIAIWRLRQADEQIRIAASDEKRKDREHVASLFQGAIQMLNGEDMTVVPLGLTQLVRVARDHPDDYLENSIALLCGIAKNFRQRQKDGVKTADEFPVYNVVQEAIYLEKEFQQKNNDFGPLDLNGFNLFFCTFENMNVRSSSIRGGEFPMSKFINCTFSGNFHHYYEEDDEDDEFDFQRGFEDSVFCGCDFSDASFVGLRMESSHLYHCNIGPNSFVNCQLNSVQLCEIFVQKHEKLKGRRQQPFTRCSCERLKFLSTASYKMEEAYNDFERPKFGGELNGFMETSFRQCFVNQASNLPIGFENLPRPMYVTVGNQSSPKLRNILNFSYSISANDAGREGEK